MKRFLVRATALAALLLLLLAALAFPRLGRWLVVEDPLAKADALYVLSGTRYERQLEAVDLYKAGWAPRVLLSTGSYDWGEVELRERGFKVPSEAEIEIEVMDRLGVPRAVIESLEEQDSTKDEADSLFRIATARHWSRVIVVTSRQHTRRARMEMNRKVSGTGVTIIMRASRYDRSNVDQWWQSRGTIRFTLFETQRLIAYWLGIAD
ncbi:MAG: YdcF family protein [Vicinamibacterales bacterium]